MTFIKFHVDFLLFSSLEFIFAGFASLRKAGRVLHTDSEQTTAKEGQNLEAGPSFYAFSPSTSVFGPNRDDQPNGAGSKKVSKQLGGRRRKTRKYKKNWDFFLWLHLTKPKRETFWTTSFIYSLVYPGHQTFTAQKNWNNRTFTNGIITLFEGLPAVRMYISYI